MRPFMVASLPIALLFSGPAAIAQDAPASDSEQAGYLERIKNCQTIENDAERLACFDTSVASMVSATESGEVQVLNQQDVEKTRRSLFGFNLPNLSIFGGSDDDSKEAKQKRNLLETKITSVHYANSNEIFFVTEEGATWRISNAPKRLRTVEVGQTVVFKRAAMGSFFIRINGQTGVKGRRVR